MVDLNNSDDYGLVDMLMVPWKWLKKGSMLDDEKIEIYDIKPEGTYSDIWLVYLPWRVSFEDAKRYGFLPNNGRLIVVDGPVSLIGSSPKLSIDSLENVMDQTKGKLNGENIGYNDVHVLGISAGGFAAINFANQLGCRSFTDLMPSASVSEVIWESSATGGVRRKARKNGIEKESYTELLGPYEPINQVGNLPKDEVRLMIAEKDRVIPVNFAWDLVERMNETEIVPNLKIYEGSGHYFSGYRLGLENRGNGDFFNLWKK